MKRDQRNLVLLVCIVGLGLLPLVVAAVSSRLNSHWNPGSIETKRSWSAKDIAGAWKYSGRQNSSTTATITFNPDGTFRQVVQLWGSRTLTQDGTWTTDSKAYFRVKVFGLLVEEGTWQKKSDYPVSWYVVDSAKRPGEFAISGSPDGSSDPDGFREFTKVSSQPATAPMQADPAR